MRIETLSAICLLVPALALASQPGATTVPPTTEASLPNPMATYRWLRSNVFSMCMYCHVSVPGVNFGTYVDTLRHIVPGDPDNSRLYVMVATRRMPKGRGGLPEEHIRAIRDWIASGAKND